jgi:hypothetical protein
MPIRRAPNPGSSHAVLGAGSASRLPIQAGGSLSIGSANRVTGPSPHGNLTVNVGWGPSVGVAPLNVSWQAIASGGTLPYLYTWIFGDGTSDSGANVSQVQQTYQWPGIYNWTLWLNDSANRTVASNGQVIVESAPVRVSNVSSMPDSVDLGEVATFRVTATGGSGVYTYSWMGLPPGCSAGNVSNFTCRPTSANRTTVVVDVWDSYGLAGSSNGSNFTSYADPYLTLVAASPSAIDLGQTTTLQAVVAAGSGGLTYNWTNLPPGCGAAIIATPSCTPSAAGHYTISVRINDSNGVSASGSMSLDVGSPLSAGNVTVSQSPIDLGQSLELSLNPSGGSFPYGFRWTGLPSGCPSVDSGLIVCTPTSTGPFTVSVQVTDGNRESQSSGELRVVVNPTLSVAVSPTNATIQVGSSWSLAVTLSGGSGPYVYSYAGLPVGCSAGGASTITCTPTKAGTYAVTITVTDAANASSYSTVTVQVTQSTSMSEAWTPYIVVALLGGVGIGAVLAAGVFLWKRRPSREGETRTNVAGPRRDS